VFQVPFIFNFFASMIAGKKVGANPWQATTLEWAATTSPPLAHGNFAVVPVVQRGPYEYSTPEYTDADFLPQHQVIGAPEPAAPAGGGILTHGAAAQQEI
jgi:cytochrome c oxidase subunit I